MPGLNTLGIWIASFLTLCIFSFLYKDNPFYKFAEHLYVGVSAAYWIVYYFYGVIIPNLWEPLYKGHNLWYLIPGILGLLVFTRFIPRFNWLSRWSFAFYIGIGVGVGIPAFFQGIIIPQMRASLVPLIDPNLLTTFNNFILVVGVLTTLFYFFFSLEHKGGIGGIAKLGIWFIMISFGASFGYTIMSRISLLIGRLNFLLGTWLHLIK